MMKVLIALTALTVTAVPATSAPCRDGKGKFVKCPDKPVAAAKCKDTKGKFAKCGTPGAKPVK